MTASVGNREDALQLLIVYLADQVFGIPISRVQDVLKAQKLTEVPMAPPYIAGVMNLRGRIVTALNLHKRIEDFHDRPSDKCMNVVVEDATELYSFLVDRVGDVLSIDANEIESPPLNLDPLWRSVTDGVYQMEDRIVLILNTEKIIHDLK